MTNKKPGNPNIRNVSKATQFKKGHRLSVGKGRPVGSVSITDALRRLMECDSPKLHPITGEKIKMRDEVGMAAMKKALTGDTAAINLILDRLEGKVPNKNENTGANGEPLKIEIEHAVCLSAIDARLAETITCGENTNDTTVSEK